MKLTEGQKFKLLADDLKQTKGLTRVRIAEMMGITKEHLSTVFRSRALTPEIKDKAIRALNLPLDYFEEKPDPPPPAATENEALKAKLALAKEKLAQLEGVYEKYVRLLEEHNQLLRQQKKE